MSNGMKQVLLVIIFLLSVTNAGAGEKVELYDAFQKALAEHERIKIYRETIFSNSSSSTYSMKVIFNRIRKIKINYM